MDLLLTIIMGVCLIGVMVNTLESWRNTMVLKGIKFILQLNSKGGEVKCIRKNLELLWTPQKGC
jgi:hypothetical protein